MANHGAVCYGEDVFKAYFRMETMEHFARIQFVAEMLGGPKVLPREEVEQAARFAHPLRREGEGQRRAGLPGGARRPRRPAAGKNGFT